MVLVDQDRTAASRDLVDRFTRLGLLRDQGHGGHGGAVEPWLVEGRAQVALVIGRGYGADTAAGRTAVGPGDRRRHRLQLGGRGPRLRVADRLGRRSRAWSASRSTASPAGSSRPRRGWRRPPRGRSSSSRASGTTPTSRAAGSTCPAVLAMVLMLVTMMLPVDGGGAREGDRHPRADQRDPAPAVAAHPREARALRRHRPPRHAARSSSWPGGSSAFPCADRSCS